jgi:hypothetical protein
MMLKKILIVLLLAGLGYANDIDKGVEALGKKDFKTALKLFTKACDSGNALGCYNLGVMYEKGEGVQQDSFKAVELYTKVCDSGNAFGCYNLGLMYYNGQGVRQDSFKTVELWTKACDGGIALGCYNLGVMYELGQGVRQDNEQALKYIMERLAI